MKRNRFIFLSLTFSLIGLLSCTEEIDLKLNEGNTRLVVEGILSTDTMQQKVVLTKTTSYFYGESAPAISGAKVQVATEGHLYDYSENPPQSGAYYSNQPFSGKQGETYDLVITDVDLNDDGNKQSYFATEKMKNVLIIDSIYAKVVTNHGKTGYMIFGYAQEPPTEKDYYMWRYYINGDLITDTMDKITFASDRLINGNYLNDFQMGYIDEGKAGDTLTVETNSITEDYFNYIISFFIETQWSSGGFGGPPANIETNIDNGAVGYFNTEARSKISLVLP